MAAVYRNAAATAAWARHQSEMQHVERFAQWWVENLALPPGATILDIGCGAGFYSHRLAEAGYRVTGVDISAPFLVYAQEQADARNLSCTFRQGSLFTLDYRHEFDATILLSGPSLQLTLPSIYQMLELIQGMLKPGGQLVSEFSVASTDVDQSEPEVDETIGYFEQSGWRWAPHVWLLRSLTFPANNERVRHHVILGDDGNIEEYWSRFVRHPYAVLTAALQRHGFQVRGVYSPTIGEPYVPAQHRTSHIWSSV